MVAPKRTRTDIPDRWRHGTDEAGRRSTTALQQHAAAARLPRGGQVSNRRRSGTRERRARGGAHPVRMAGERCAELASERRARVGNRGLESHAVRSRVMYLRIALALLACLPAAAQAHSAFIVPSETVLSAPGWITVDAAISNDLFYFNHAPMRLENLKITGPDGAAVTPE